MRLALALLALLAAVPAQAQELQRAVWAGVWEGTIGTLPIRACMERYVGEDGEGRGSYYYLSRLEPIPLQEALTEDPSWIEHAPGSDAEATWEFEYLGDRIATGTWRQGRRALPISLAAVPWEDSDWGGPCGSRAYFEPRLVAGEVRYENWVLESLRYVKSSWTPPAHWKDEVTVETFMYDGEEPGDPAINAELQAYLPTGGWDDDFLECLAGNIAAAGQDGFFEQTLEPTLFTRAFIAVKETSATHCGGAHPNYYTVAHTYDRRSGKGVDLYDWLGEARIDAEDSMIPDALRTLVLVRWPRHAEAECRELAAEAEYWSLGLAREGIAFMPDFPHVATACEEAVTVEWDALDPFLDQDGREGLARLRAR